MLVHCKLCGAEYDYCAHCAGVKSWKKHTDTADHYAIWTALMTYQTDHDAESAYHAIAKRGVDFRHTEEYLPGASAIMEEICSRVSPVKKERKVRSVPICVDYDGSDGEIDSTVGED